MQGTASEASRIDTTARRTTSERPAPSRDSTEVTPFIATLLGFEARRSAAAESHADPLRFDMDEIGGGRGSFHQLELTRPNPTMTRPPRDFFQHAIMLRGRRCDGGYVGVCFPILTTVHLASKMHLVGQRASTPSHSTRFDGPVRPPLRPWTATRLVNKDFKRASHSANRPSQLIGEIPFLTLVVRLLYFLAWA